MLKRNAAVDLLSAGPRELSQLESISMIPIQTALSALHLANELQRFFRACRFLVFFDTGLV